MTTPTDDLIALSVAEAQLAHGLPLRWVVAHHGPAAQAALPEQWWVETRAPHWTEEEEEFLRQNLGRLPEAEIAAHLGRSVNAVHLRWSRDLDLPAPASRRHPAWVTAHQTGRLLGIDGKAVLRLIELGRLPGRVLPGGRQIRVIQRVTLRRWAVNPANWIYILGAIKNTARIGDPDLRRLIERQKTRWGDEWWSPGQAAAYHGVEHTDINRYLHAGKLKGVRWANWHVLRSEATRPNLVFFKGKGAAQGFREWGDSGDAFLILARAVGLIWDTIGGLMNGRRGACIRHRLLTLHRQGQVARLIEAYRLPVEYDPATGSLFADWRACRDRFPYLDKAAARFRRGDRLRPAQLALVRAVLAHWAEQYAAADEAQRRLARNLGRANKVTETYVRQAYAALCGWDIDPLA